MECAATAVRTKPATIVTIDASRSRSGRDEAMTAEKEPKTLADHRIGRKD